MLDNRRPGQHAVRIAQKIFQKRIFLARQHNFTLASPDSMGGRVQLQIGQLQPSRSLDGATAEQRPYTRQQFSEGKRLGEIIVRPTVQAADFIFRLIAHGQEQHRNRLAFITEYSTYAQSILPGEHDVQNNHVIGGGLSQRDGSFSIHGNIDRIAFLL